MPYDYEAELQKIADDVQKVHPIGEVKAIGLMEAHQACREVFDELLSLRHFKEMSEILSQVSRETEERFVGVTRASKTPVKRGPETVSRGYFQCG